MSQNNESAKQELRDGVWTDPARCGGAPCIEGTRIPVWCVLRALEHYADLSGIRKQYPGLTDQNAKDALWFAQRMLNPDEPAPALKQPKITREQALAAVNHYNIAMWGEGPIDNTELENALLHELGIEVDDTPKESEMSERDQERQNCAQLVTLQSQHAEEIALITRERDLYKRWVAALRAGAPANKEPRL